MRIAKVIAVMLFVPLLGVIAGIVVGVITLTIILKGRQGGPGDGILIMLFGSVALLISIPLAFGLAVRLWTQSSANEQSTSN
jgi:integral membrane sensor domain MASE1